MRLIWSFKVKKAFPLSATLAADKKIRDHASQQTKGRANQVSVNRSEGRATVSIQYTA